MIIIKQELLSDWQEITQRPIPSWFDDDKFGIFIHWGIYSVPAYAPRRGTINGDQCYAEWYGWHMKHLEPFQRHHKRFYGEDFHYEDFAGRWKAEFFDADRWMRLFKRSGARYVVAVAKHHDAFCLWPSRYSWNWNSMDIGPHRNIIGELMNAADKAGLRRGLYYSLLEWYNPYIINENNPDYDGYATQKMIPQLKELVEKYRPEILFTDGEWAASSEQWHSLEFLKWLVSSSPVKDTVVFNDRWGNDTRGRFGGYFTCEYGEVNSKIINETEAQRNLGRRKWEECRSIGASFGFNRNETMEDYMSEYEVIRLLVDTVSRGGNLCLNVGPCADGIISPIIEERLLQCGKWLEVNGEAIYKTRPVTVHGLSGARATRTNDAIYVFFDKGYGQRICIKHSDITCKASAEILGENSHIEYSCGNGEIVIKIPYIKSRAVFNTVKISLNINSGGN